MSTFEQRQEAPDPKYRYLLFAAEPYETIGFKIPSWEIDRDPLTKQVALNTNWDRDTLKFTVIFLVFFLNEIRFIYTLFFHLIRCKLHSKNKLRKKAIRNKNIYIDFFEMNILLLEIDIIKIALLKLTK